MTVTGEHAPANPERVALFGSEGGFSRPLLAGLLAQGVAVVAVVMPGVAAPEIGGDIPVTVKQPLNLSGLAGLAAAHAIPVLRSRHPRDPRLIGELAALAIDVMLVACFPLILPETIWRMPRLACWNLHPSLLPAYRGPTPLYWQRRKKERHTGVTLHEVTQRIDAGGIVAQRALPLPAGTGDAELDAWVAGIGVDLFLQALHYQREGRLLVTQQDETAASYYPYPDKTRKHPPARE